MKAYIISMECLIHLNSTYFAPSETKATYLCCISPYSHYFLRDRTFFAFRVFLLIICKELENRLNFDDSWRGYPTLRKRKLSKRRGAAQNNQAAK